MRERMKTRFTKFLHVCSAVVAVLAFSTIGFFSCGAKSYLAQITISPSEPGMAIGTSYQLSGYGVLSNGVTFFESYLTWTSSNTDIATVDSSGLVTAGSATGTTEITATETDSHTNVAGSTVVTVCTVSAISITPTNPIMSVDTSYQFAALAELSALSSGVTPTQYVTSYMTWTTSNSDVATVDSGGIVTAGSTTGTATLTATQGDTILVPGDTPIVVETTLTVTASALSSIAVTAENDTTSIATGSTVQLTATGTFADDSTDDVTSHVTWSSSDTTLATVDAATGLVTGVGAGTVTITAADPITAVSGSIDITIN
jgi:uncharacterized protein YjdB